MPLQGTGLFTCSSYPDIVLQFNSVLNTVSELSGSVTLLLEADKPFEHPFPAIVTTANGIAVGELHTHKIHL